MFVLDPIRDFELEERVAAFYSPRLPYHNFKHVLDTLEYADGILRRCLDRGVKIDVPVVYLALLFHDAGFQSDHRALGFPTKEAYSVHLAREELTKNRISKKVIEHACECIDGTEKDGHFQTVEAKIVRAADLAGMASSYGVFLQNAIRLWNESNILSGKRPKWNVWKDQVRERIEFYLSQKIEITPEDTSTHFHEGTRKNLEKFLNEPEPINPQG